MPSLSLSPRTAGVFFLSLSSFVSSQSIPGASLFVGNGAPGAGTYQLVDDYEPAEFFNKFNFYSVRKIRATYFLTGFNADSIKSYDPTFGHVQYATSPSVVFQISNIYQICGRIDCGTEWLRDHGK